MKTRKLATDEAFLNEAQTLLCLPPTERNVALDMLQRLRASLDLLDFIGFADEPAARLSKPQAEAQSSIEALEEMAELLVGPNKKLTPNELVAMVKELAVSARAGFASGGNGKPWSATLTDDTLSEATLETAEEDISKSLHGLARSAASIGIEVSIECDKSSVEEGAGYVLSGGIARSQRLLEKLNRMQAAALEETKEAAL